MIELTRTNESSLSIPERIQLVTDIWDTIAEVSEEVGLSEEQKAELDRRLEAYHPNPSEGFPWSLVKERIVTLPVFHARRDPARWQGRISPEP
ncbi:MAG: addiction module protein [Candidatus Fermentibacteraceae bacterium]